MRFEPSKLDRSELLRIETWAANLNGLTAEKDYTGAAGRERVSRKLTADKGLPRKEYTAADEGLHGR